MPAAISLFIAPTALEARRAAWQFLGENRATAPQDLFDAPLIFTDASGARAWRDLAREGCSQTTLAPRFARAEAFFARLHTSISDKRALSGADRLWVLQNATRRAATKNEAALPIQPEFLAHFAVQIAALRSANLKWFPTDKSAVEGAAQWNQWLRAYDARLDEIEAFDFEAAPALFALSAARNQQFPRPRALGVDGLLDPSLALQMGFDALLERVEIVAATLICPGAMEDDAALQGALAFWKSRGAQIVRVGDLARKTVRVAAKILGAESDEIEAPNHLFLTPAHTPQSEMQLIAVQIRREIEAGARPDDFCLAFADLKLYEGDARYAFAQYGVPLDWPRARDLTTSPLVRALLRAARSCQTPLGVHELHDLFGDGTLRLQSEEKVFNARRLRAAARAANHPELDDLDAARAAFERKRAQFTKSPRHDDEVLRAHIETSILAGDLELVALFETLRAPFCHPCSARAWQNQLLELTDALAGHWLQTETENEAATEAATRAQSNIARFKTAIEAVVERARSWADNENQESEKKSADEWLRWLEIEIAQRATEDVESQSGGVRAVSISRFDFGARATFFCGLSERAWPISIFGGALERELHPILNAHLASPLARATNILARAIGETPALYLSHANFVAGKETPASPLLEDLKSAFPKFQWPRLDSTTVEATRRGWLKSSHLWLWNGGVFDAGFEVDFHKKSSDWPSENSDLPAHLQTLFAARAARRAGEIGVYDGVLGPRGRELMEARDAQNGGARLSGSDLEFYARCPIRYFFERVLQLRFESRGDGDIDAREAGNLIHEIARRFLHEWKTPLQSEDFELALQFLGKITSAECEKLPLRPILREAEWHRLMGASGRSGPLVKWLQLEIALGAGAWNGEMRPFVHSPVQIDGVTTGLEHRFDFEIGGHKVKGFIDRLDVSPDAAQIAVIDYKTGDVSSLPSWKAGDSGLHFQLAIYALAVRNLTEHLAVKPRLAMAYLSLRGAKIARGIGQENTLGKGCSGAKMLGDAQFDDWLEDARGRAIRIADLRARGVFNISLQSAKDAKCGSCSSKTLCGQHAETQEMRLETHRASPFYYAPLLREWDA